MKKKENSAVKEAKLDKVCSFLFERNSCNIRQRYTHKSAADVYIA
jgi:hypothetical protein